MTGTFRIIKGHAFEGRDFEVEGHALLQRGWFSLDDFLDPKNLKNKQKIISLACLFAYI